MSRTTKLHRSRSRRTRAGTSNEPTSGPSSSRAERTGGATRGRRMTAGAIEVPAARSVPEGGGRRSAIVSALLLLPAAFWYLVLLIIPLALVVVVSFGIRGT